ncbi:pyruvate dehydrogenase (acetyl-transferring), homodimeric type [Draconibacterium halophilum]|uniref:Pyruvate dehydrogenase E1 component n=1 Tax=Draconibacterium halophilum TaxID=2706887 RepID=A0A6C0RFC0_9BACT|nr:pyruvate dehydrogenase (acetyl-transferring), homodimeric type [Draconibacterium halophilum]QIA09100.1 pyruvate dehydrogenase (acetyl-transferring), homodimeric type [Draconibacterium halophilum]
MTTKNTNKIRAFENQEWLDSLEYLIKNDDDERVTEILDILRKHALEKGITKALKLTTPYINSIPKSEETDYPGDRDLERKIKSIIRWNAMAMVVQANKKNDGIGGHISTYASAATLYEVAFNHFFRGGDNGDPADLIYFQGHASPGIYARSFLEGRFSEKMLENFRKELKPDGGLSSYPHPRLMKDYWQFPTVSMGLGPIMAIYQARFNKYLQDKGLLDNEGQKVWAFLGDGEMDEPESLGALTLASREELDNLIFVVNCNLQRLDGPVRGNSSVIEELEGAFSGAGWNVIKVTQGSKWDALLQKDKTGILKKRLGELVDGERQKYSISKGDYIREEFFGKYDELREMVKEMSDKELEKLNRGGHDPQKVYNAFKRAQETQNAPTVILASTIKGYGLGEAGEGRNITHQQKKLNEEELMLFRDRFNIPISDDEVAKAPFYKPDDESPEMKYLLQQRKQLGGFLPKRRTETPDISLPENKVFDEFFKGSGKREVATTMVAVQLISKMLKDKNLEKLVVPIVPDESRTFGMDSLFRQVGIYAHKGQLYEPVDRDNFLYYKEAKDGAILEEGITEAGAISSFIAAGTAYSTHQINCIPFYIFYSMFGFQRVGDFIWAAADARAKGFLLGGTAGRTTLAGEGLQHQDGQSHIQALSIPGLRAYDPAFAYEIAVIIRDGINRMYKKGEEIFYYLTIMNEKYKMPAMPAGKDVEKGIINGLYKYRRSTKNKHNLHLLGSGSILNEALKARDLLKKDFDIYPEVWSVTSYKQLYDDATETQRNNRISGENKKSWIQESVGTKPGIFVAASDYLKALPLSVSKWFPGSFTALGTDGFGLSENREELRNHFETDAKHIAWAALVSLHDAGKFSDKKLQAARKKLEILSDKSSAKTHGQ